MFCVIYDMHYIEYFCCRKWILVLGSSRWPTLVAWWSNTPCRSGKNPRSSSCGDRKRSICLPTWAHSSTNCGCTSCWLCLSPRSRWLVSTTGSNAWWTPTWTSERRWRPHCGSRSIRSSNKVRLANITRNPGNRGGTKSLVANALALAALITEDILAYGKLAKGYRVKDNSK